MKHPPKKSGQAMTNKFDTQGNDYRAPEERNINSHGFQPVVQKKDRTVLAGFLSFLQKS